MQDYRNESYADIAEDNKPAEGTSISINPDYIVIGSSGRVAIRPGNQDDRYIYTDNTTGNVVTEPATPVVSEVAPNPFQPASEKVEVSPGIASKLSGQSLRGDRSYYVNVEQSKRPKPQSRLPANKNNDKATKINEINNLNQGYITAAPQPTTAVGKLRKYASEKEYEAFQSDSKLVPEFKAAGASAAATFVYPFTSPIGFAKDVFSFGKSVVTEPFTVGYAIKEQIVTTPGIFVGEQLGNIGLAKTPKLVKNVYIKVGSTYVAPEKVFDVGVLKGESVFPETSNIKESMTEFNTPNREGKIVVQTSSPAKIGGDTAGVGKKAGMGLEDPGIYVTPEGRGSPVFTGVFGKGYDVSLNPLKNSFGVPTVTKFEVVEVVQYPRSVINQPGFEGVGMFQKDVLAGENVAVITKRSEIGQGNIAANGLKGTTEIEAVVPLGAKFEYQPKSVLGKLKGFDEFTMLDGEPVAIRSAKLVGKSERVYVNTRLLSTREIVKGSESLSSVGKRSVSPSYPLSSSIGRSLNGSVVSSVESSSVSRGSSVGSSVSNISVSSVGSSVSDMSKSSSGLSSSSFGLSSMGGSSLVSVKGSSVSRGVSGSSFSGGSASFVAPPVKIDFGKFKRDSSSRVFGVVVRRGGVFKSVATGLSASKALRFGAGRVRGSAAASFQVTKLGRPVDVVAPSGFYKKGLTLIEENKFRINTPGELKDITYVGIRTQVGGKR